MGYVLVQGNAVGIVSGESILSTLLSQQIKTVQLLSPFAALELGNHCNSYMLNLLFMRLLQVCYLPVYVLKGRGTD